MYYHVTVMWLSCDCHVTRDYCVTVMWLSCDYLIASVYQYHIAGIFRRGIIFCGQVGSMKFSSQGICTHIGVRSRCILVVLWHVSAVFQVIPQLSKSGGFTLPLSAAVPAANECSQTTQLPFCENLTHVNFLWYNWSCFHKKFDSQKNNTIYIWCWYTCLWYVIW